MQNTQSHCETPSAAPLPAWAADVLAFWFDEIGAERWFVADALLDEQIRRRFLGVHGEVSLTTEEALLANSRTALAAVIVLDQFSRNMFRGTPHAFASDGKALRLAEEAIHRRYDIALDISERLFLYLPFEHCEDSATQARCVELMSTLGDAEWTRYAEAHQAIIDRFGRFPHRNDILGRNSTPEETAFLKQPGSSF